MSDDSLRRRRELRLVQRLLAGEEAAFEELADGHFEPLLRFALSKLGDQEELAGDVVQSSLTIALRRLSSFRGDSSLMTWLFGICRFEISNILRSRRRAPETVQLEESDGALEEGFRSTPTPTPAEVLEQKERAGQVHMTLDGLPVHYAQALEWKYLEGASVVEIGRRLQLGTKAAESLLGRARRAFKDGFDSVWGQDSGLLGNGSV